MASRIRAALLCFALGTAPFSAGISGAAPLATAPTLEFRLSSASFPYTCVANPAWVEGTDGTYSSEGAGRFGSLAMAWHVVVDPDPRIAGTRACSAPRRSAS